jgi:glycosyltransferase involved in cell wall biosynthesis
MRILHVGKYYPPVPGGMERFLGDLAEAQRARGDSVAVLVHGDRHGGPCDDPSWLMRCPVWARLVFAPVSPAFPLWLTRALRRHDPQVLHLHMPNPSAFWALALPAARRVPWVVHWHSDVVPSRHKPALRLAYPFYRVFERALLERADIIIATSRPYLEASAPLRPWRDKCRVVPLGVDGARLPDVVPGAGDAVWPGQGLRVLAIGRLSYYKGFETLIEAVSSATGMQLILVGEGEERPRLEQCWRAAGRPGWIRLVGQLDDAACLRLLTSCDVFCLPSRERTEAFGIVLMEAMRYGKPLVAARIEGSGVTWVAREGVNARLVPTEDPVALRRALTDLGNDAEARQSLGLAGRRRFLEEFDIRQVASRLHALYACLVLESGRTTVSDRALVVIPALDEAASIAEVIARIRAVGITDILVVDDHSTDATADVARRTGARVLRAPLPQGAWGAMQTGIRHAVRAGYGGVITMDADGQHEPSHLPDLLHAGQSVDVVIGACPERGSWPRKLAWRYFRMLTGFGYEDLTSGFRYYNRRACELLAEEEATLLDYQDIGVMLLLRKAGLSIGEIAVSMQPRRNGGSRIFSSWFTVGRYMAETTLLCLARWHRKTTRS